MSRYDEIPGIKIDPSKTMYDAANDAIDAYYKVASFAVHEVARSEGMKQSAILGWAFAGIFLTCFLATYFFGIAS